MPGRTNTLTTSPHRHTQSKNPQQKTSLLLDDMSTIRNKSNNQELISFKNNVWSFNNFLLGYFSGAVITLLGTGLGVGIVYAFQ